MTSAVFSFPTTVIFGAGQVRELTSRIPAWGSKRPLVITDPGVYATAAFNRAMDAVPGDAVTFLGIHSNPLEEDVELGTKEFVKGGCDAVIAIGGGSALDVGKVVRLVAKRGMESLRNPPRWDESVGELAPFVAIPTTAGTGSEVGRSSVVTVEGKKRVVFHPALLAKLVILDPELTVELPAKLTAATGADALTHCIESYTSPEFQPLCDGIALEGIRLITREGALLRAVREPGDLDARGKMLVAAMMGGIAFQKDLGAAHSLAHPLSAICGLHHGLANALVLPAVMAFNAKRKQGAYGRVGEAMGLVRASDEQVVSAVRGLLEEIGLGGGLQKQGVKEEQIAQLVEQAWGDPCHRTNPVPVTRGDLEKLYRDAM